MSTLRVSNIEAKADVSSPSVNEKVKVTNSNGELLIHIDGATSGITTVGISTSGESFRFDSNQNVTFFGSVTGTGLDVNGNADISGNLNVGGVLTYEDVTNIDSVGVITARSGLQVTGGSVGIGTDNPEYQTTIAADGPNAKLNIKRKTAAGSNGNAFGSLFYTNSDGTDVASIRAHRESANDDAYLGFATRNTGGSITERLRITSAGVVGINKSSPSSHAQLDIVGSSYWPILVKTTSTTGGGIAIKDKDDVTSLYVGSGGSSWLTGSPITDGLIRAQNNLLFATNGNNERLRIDSSGRMGLGISSPARGGLHIHQAATAELHLTDNTTGSGSGDGFTLFSASSSAGVWYRENAPLRFATNNTERVRINSAGNMGVGISDPSQARLVAQTASGMSIAAVKDNTGASISLGGVTQPRVLMEAGASASQFKLYTSSGSSYSSPDWRQRLHLTPTNASVSSAGSGANGIGCLGINDTSPDSKALALSLRGTYGMEDPRPLVYLQRSYGVGGGSSTDETTLEISAPGSYNSAGVIYGIKCRAQHNLNGSHYAGHFENNGSQYSANGTSALYAKTTKLDTNGSGDVIAFRADASITTGIANNGAAIAGYFASGNNINGKPIVCQNGLTSNNWANQIIFRKHNGSSVVEVGSIKSSNTATQYNTNSDYRLKENVISLTGAIDRLKQLQPKRFNFIGIDETIDGFIAHEVNLVAPYAVSGEKDAVKKELVLDEKGNEQFDGNGEIVDREVIDPQSVDYSKLVTLAIAALQEEIARREALEDQYNALADRITALEP